MIRRNLQCLLDVLESFFVVTAQMSIGPRHEVLRVDRLNHHLKHLGRLRAGQVPQ